MDQHRHLVLAQAENISCPGIDDLRHALHLQEVVPRPERPELICAPHPRPVRHRHRIGARQTPLRFGVLDVLRRADPVLGQQDPRTVHQHPVERRALQPQRTAVAAADRHAPGDLVHQRLGAASELAHGQRQRKQPHTAVDVVPDPAGRDDPVRRLGRGHATHREAVPLMDVGHRQRRPGDPRQRRHVLQLLERPIGRDLPDQLAVREHPRRHPHVRARLRSQLPHDLINLTKAADASRRDLRHRAPPSRGSREVSAQTPGRGRWRP
jgi:hypothetical protein